MPYITQSDRHPLDEGLRTPLNPGELNYAITKAVIDGMADPALLHHTLRGIVDAYLKLKGTRYSYINDIVGALTCAKLEFIRRTDIRRFDGLFDDVARDVYTEVGAPYEDGKINENGDVYPPMLRGLPNADAPYR